MKWVSAEPFLLSHIMERLYSSPLMDKVNKQIFDYPPQEVEGNTYIVVGESDVNQSEYSQGLSETIIMTFHVYHKNLNSPEKATRYTKDVVTWLKFWLLHPVDLPFHISELVKLESSQVINDVDINVKHGIVTVRYKMRHKTLNN
ncbi:hypothetical protein [Macrococcus capreoli]|uniref:hypothetical protein n=1 Tax=Macrococcus capreoli TaxID=2982690 RepID=UPI003EE7396C